VKRARLGKTNMSQQRMAPQAPSAFFWPSDSMMRRYGKGDVEWLVYWAVMWMRVTSVGGPHVDLS
jgi:hypothetical protein